MEDEDEKRINREGVILLISLIAVVCIVITIISLIFYSNGKENAFLSIRTKERISQAETIRIEDGFVFREFKDSTVVKILQSSKVKRNNIDCFFYSKFFNRQQCNFKVVGDTIILYNK